MYTLIGQAFLGGFAVMLIMGFINYLIGKFDLRFEK